jgi:hypothetical protein
VDEVAKRKGVMEKSENYKGRSQCDNIRKR